VSRGAAEGQAEQTREPPDHQEEGGGNAKATGSEAGPGAELSVRQRGRARATWRAKERECRNVSLVPELGVMPVDSAQQGSYRDRKTQTVHEPESEWDRGSSATSAAWRLNSKTLRTGAPAKGLRVVHDKVSVRGRRSRRRCPDAISSGSVITMWLRLAKAVRRFDAQTQNQDRCGERSGGRQQQDPLSRLANVAPITCGPNRNTQA
jgi:hypothetical protein